jgi:hypothetical protein
MMFLPTVIIGRLPRRYACGKEKRTQIFRTLRMVSGLQCSRKIVQQTIMLRNKTYK